MTEFQSNKKCPNCGSRRRRSEARGSAGHDTISEEAILCVACNFEIDYYAHGIWKSTFDGECELPYTMLDQIADHVAAAREGDDESTPARDDQRG